MGQGLEICLVVWFWLRTCDEVSQDGSQAEVIGKLGWGGRSAFKFAYVAVCRWLQFVPMWVSPQDFLSVLAALQEKQPKREQPGSHSTSYDLVSPVHTANSALFCLLEMKSKFQATIKNGGLRLPRIPFKGMSKNF